VSEDCPCPPTGKPSQTVLVVDDSREFRQALVDLLEESGFRCLQVGDAHEAMALLGRRRVCIGVLDIGLPGMSGAQLAWKIRQREPDLPLVAVSGMLETWDRDDLTDLGFTRVFPKPLDGDEFVRECVGLCRRGSGLKLGGGPDGRSEADA
jgi:DNA-binding response OmpR family regulator